MEGFINSRGLLAGLCGVTLAAISGCYTYADLVDPCYPMRYEAMSRKTVNDTIAPQVENGHVLDQTIWNYHFEAGTAHLTAGGLAKLSDLARHRPAPDTLIWLQTAEDIDYDPAVPTKFVDLRKDLNEKRKKAILAYLDAETSGRNLTFEVMEHNPAEAGFSAAALGASATGMHGKFGGAPGGGGGAPPPK